MASFSDLKLRPDTEVLINTYLMGGSLKRLHPPQETDSPDGDTDVKGMVGTGLYLETEGEERG